MSPQILTFTGLPESSIRRRPLFRARISVSPTRTASARIASALLMSSRPLTPLSEMKIVPSGTRFLSSPACLVSTVKSFRFRLLTPMIRAPASAAIRISSALCASKIAESPRLSASCRKSRSCTGSRIEQMRRTASAPIAFASRIMYSSTVKSLRRIGMSVTRLISVRYLLLPLNQYGSVRQEMQDAPALS